jgi:thiol-disulfide isomerase/thioredoxin
MPMLTRTTLIALVLAVLVTSATVARGVAQHEEDAFVGQKAPVFKESPTWINSSPLKLESLKGKVVLLQFWAFDCPFCAEATPRMIEWNQKYAKDGLVVIGVHTPRLDYEKDVARIREAVTKKGIKYAVVVDNKYDIWSDYLCNVWPSHFVIDQQGVIQLSHSGVGRYEDTEKVIQRLLARK